MNSIFTIISYFIFFISACWCSDLIFNTSFIDLISYPFKSKSVGGDGVPSLGFKDIGGLQEAKEELGEIVSYFRNPQVF